MLGTNGRKVGSQGNLKVPVGRRGACVRVSGSDVVVTSEGVRGDPPEHSAELKPPALAAETVEV